MTWWNKALSVFVAIMLILALALLVGLFVFLVIDNSQKFKLEREKIHIEGHIAGNNDLPCESCPYTLTDKQIWLKAWTEAKLQKLQKKE